MSVPDFSSRNDENFDEKQLIIDELQKAEPFSSIPLKVLKVISETAAYRNCNTEETVLANSQYDGSSVFVVSSGSLKSACLNEETGEMQLFDIPTGSSYGLSMAISDLGKSNCNQLTLTAGESGATLIVIEADRFREIILQRPTLSRVLMQHFADMLVRQEMSTPVSSDNSSKRIYSELLKLLERDVVADNWRIEKMPKHREVAQLAGVEEAEAASAIAIIIQEGVARRDYPGLIIDDIGRLNHLAS